MRDEPNLAASVAPEHVGDASPPEALSDEARTLSAIPLVPPRLVARVQDAIAGAPRSPLMPVTILATLLLIAALGGAALASGFGLARGGRTIFMPSPVVTATPQLGKMRAPSELIPGSST